MNEYQQYFAEEIASDCGQGHITRHEALRRLRVLGIGAAAALSLLAACGSDEGDEPAQMVATNEPAAPAAAGSSNARPSPAATSTPNSNAPAMPAATPGGEGNPTPAPPPAANPSPSAPPPAMAMPGATPTPQDLAAISGPGMGLPTEAITFDGPNGPLQGAFAAAPTPRGAVLVIHENRGLNDHIRTVVGRFAAAGFTAIGLDLLSEEGGTGTDAAAAMQALSAAPPERFVADMRAALAELERRAPGAKIGAVGFCFGGGMMWRLIASGDERLAAAAPFYGPLPTGADFSSSNAAVLAFYGELDARVNASRDAAQAALTAAGLTNEVVTEPASNHAFFNDTGMNYNQAAATDAWARVLAWFSEHLAASPPA